MVNGIFHCRIADHDTTPTSLQTGCQPPFGQLTTGNLCNKT
jgi:hypothetical protein